MDALMNQVGAAGKPKAESRPKQSAQGGNPAESGFQSALRERRGSWTRETAAAERNPSGGPAGADQTQTEGPAAPWDLEQRMLLAAMSLAQNPIPFQQAEPIQPEAPSVQMPVVSDSVEAAEPSAGKTLEPSSGTQLPTEEPAAAKPQAPAPQAKSVQGEVVVQKQPTAAPQTEMDPAAERRMEKETVRTSPAQETPLFREVRAVPIQVGEAASGEKAERPVSTQLGDRIAEAVRSGETRVELELEPRNLGRVKIELVWHQDGTMHVMLQAEKAKTQMLLARDAGELQSILGRSGQQEVRVETPEYQTQQAVYHEQQNQQNQPDQQDQQQERQNPHHEQHPGSGESFLQQLRLGLIPVEETVS